MIIVSMCLAGICCRYDGKNKLVKEIKNLVEKGKALPLCPEQLGGLPTPRKRAEIKGGEGRDVWEGKAKVINEAGVDVTKQYIKGAEEVLKLAKMVGAKEAILKTKSASCGKDEIYDGTFSAKLKKGTGITATFLMENGIKVKTEL